MTAVCLELNAYTHALSWAYSVVGKREYLRSCKVDEQEDPMIDKYYAKAYYNKA